MIRLPRLLVVIGAALLLGAPALAADPATGPVPLAARRS